MSYKPLSEWLQPLKQSAIAEACETRAATVHEWYHGRSFPPPEVYPALAALLNITVEQLADIIFEDKKQRALARAAEVA